LAKPPISLQDQEKLNDILINYRGKEWKAKELILSLHKEVRELKKNKCKPSVNCLFEGQRYLDEKYLDDYEHRRDAMAIVYGLRR